jgi:hypothetical protein
VIWTGWGESASPLRDDERLVDRLGVSVGLDLVPVVHQLEDEFYKSDARSTVADLAEMGRLASERFRQLHPEISKAGVDALAWCYTYDFK